MPDYDSLMDRFCSLSLRTRCLSLVNLAVMRLIRLNGIILILSLPFVVSCASSRYETSEEPRTAVASWYGAEFHGKSTASGEKFDMYGLTCAHRELPFGSVLEVTNVATGKTVKCVVNDRGPFVSGRDLDLSYAAAKEIGLRSTGPVRIVYVGRKDGYARAVKYASSGGPYTVQVGAFTEKDNALRLKAGLELKYKDVYIIDVTVKDTTFYRVRIGKFRKRSDASSFGKTLAEEGYSPVITHYDERT